MQEETIANNKLMHCKRKATKQQTKKELSAFPESRKHQ
jgi:hypothetical protein